MLVNICSFASPIADWRMQKLRLNYRRFGLESNLAAVNARRIHRLSLSLHQLTLFDESWSGWWWIMKTKKCRSSLCCFHNVGLPALRNLSCRWKKLKYFHTTFSLPLTNNFFLKNEVMFISSYKIKFYRGGGTFMSSEYEMKSNWVSQWVFIYQ